MILFLDDWQKYPNAIVHKQTPNTSYLRLAELYKSMGVENFYFHLALMQPELIGVNPHDPHLSKELKYMIAMECRFNPWYYFREVALVPPQAGVNPLPLEANRGNVALWWCFFNHVDIALIQPRQTGKSLSVDELMIYLLDIATTNTDINLLTKDDQLRVANVDRLKEIRGLVPAWLTQKQKNDTDNKEGLTCNRLNNKYKTSVAQGSIVGANNVGRGLTAPIIDIDEGPFCTNIDITIPAMLASAIAAREEAIKVGAHYGNIFTTTAGKKDTKSGRYMYDMIFGGMPWSEKLFDCKDQRELERVVEKGSPGKKPMINATFSYKQLGKDDNWLVKTIRLVTAKPDEAERDFLNVWTSGTTSSPLSVELNNIIRESAKEPRYIEITREAYAIRWYIPQHEIQEYMANNKLVLGMDTSEAINRDAITLLLVNVKTLEVVAAGHFNETNLIRFSAFVANFMIRWSNVTLIPERRSTGQTLIDTLLIHLPAKGIDPFTRIFNIAVQEMHERQELFKAIEQTPLLRRQPEWYDKYKSYFGYATAGSGKYTRNILYSDVLQTAARRGGNKVRDIPLIDEITGLMVKNGRIDHDNDSHDDMVIAWLLATWLLLYGKNLQYYGIERPLSECLDATIHKDPEREQELLMKKHQEEKIKEQMFNILEEIKDEDNDFILVKLEQRLRYLDSQLGGEFSQTDSVDELLNQAREIRAKKARQRKRHLSPQTNPTRGYNYSTYR